PPAMASSPMPWLDALAPLVQRQALQPAPTSSEQQQPQEEGCGAGTGPAAQQRTSGGSA
ncbi:hypothetical protein HaLaN_26653, partial [Haematococcus lacustris]